jgi:hypothetical protein
LADAMCNEMSCSSSRQVTRLTAHSVAHLRNYPFIPKLFIHSSKKGKAVLMHICNESYLKGILAMYQRRKVGRGGRVTAARLAEMEGIRKHSIYSLDVRN